MFSACVSDSIGSRDRISARRRGAIGWPFSQGLLFTILLIAPLIYLSGCGPGQTDTGAGNSVPVSLNISMPQESAAASTSGSRFWATVQSWLPSLSNAWAAGTADLSTLTVEVTGPGIPSPITSPSVTLSAPKKGDVIPVELDVPVGPDRVFIAHGFDAAGLEISKGESTPIMLTVGQSARVDITLVDVGQPTISDPASLPIGVVGTTYSATLTATGGTPPFTWSIITGTLPIGLSLNPQTGVIAGTASATGTFDFTANVTDSTGQTDPTPPPLSITITQPAPPTITTSSPLPTGTVNQPYPTTTLTATGDTTPDMGSSGKPSIAQRINV